MNKILTLDQAFTVAKELQNQKKTIVLTGGCFDILHPGHLVLLQKAKAKGDVLLVLLENDEKIKKLKGTSRPIFSQVERARMLAAFSSIDYIIMLPLLQTDNEYDAIISKLSPNFIATTKNDPRIKDKRRQAKMIDAKVMEVTKYLPKYATSKILNMLQKEI